MKKKLALIVISLDECFSKKGFSGGGHKVTKNLILGLIESNKFDIDIFCKASAVDRIHGINSITVLHKETFVPDLKKLLHKNKYDYVLSSDVLLPFANNLIHSNSARYKSKTGKNKFMQKVLKVYNSKKIQVQKKSLEKNHRAVFVVSQSLKNDYVINYNLDENKVFVCHPAVDDYSNVVSFSQKEDFVVGGMAGGGLNKGGYLLLFALKKLPKTSKIKARIIFPKIKKSGFFKLLVRALGLQKKIEILPKQHNMVKYYKSIDCYVLPSLNEAFGLVVTEAASCFKPSLVSSTTGVRELIQDGENGFVFNREETPAKNLAKKLREIEKMYFTDNEQFVKISQNAHKMSKKLDWKKFVDTIINNMIAENFNIKK